MFVLSSLVALCVVGCSSNGAMSNPDMGSSGAAGSVTSHDSGGSGAAGVMSSAGSAAASGSAGPTAAGSGAGGTMPRADAGRGAAGGGGSGAAAGAAGTAAAGTSGSTQPVVMPVALPDGAPGIGFDDIDYSPELKKLLVPAGRTGNIYLIDPITLDIATISGFSKTTMFTLGKHRSGSTSASYGDGKIFAIDNETKTVRVIDPATNMITFSSMLAAPPDYVRWVETTREIWVTGPNNPGVTQSANPGIEVFTVPANAAPVHAAMIPTSNGPEALAVDNTRHRVYTNAFQGGTYAIDMTQRAIVATWKNGCSGLTVDAELDEARGFLMVVCANPGRVAVLDVVNGGTQLGEVSTGAGLDVSAYNVALHHLYIAGQTSKDLAIIAVSAAGVPTILGTVATAAGSQMVASDEYGNAWVGDPGGGRLLKVRDTYPTTP